MSEVNARQIGVALTQYFCNLQQALTLTRQGKCDTLHPNCSPCQISGEVCTYECPNRKRGLPQGYVCALEELLTLEINNVEGFQDKILALLREQRSSIARQTDHKSIHSIDSESVSWRDSDLYRALMNTDVEKSVPGCLTSGLSAGLGVVKADSSHQYRLNGHFGAMGDRASVIHVNPSTPMLIDGRLPHQVPGSSSSVSAHHFPQKSILLIDRYFAITHYWLPILSKGTMLRAFYLHDSKFYQNAANLSGSGDYAALWAILAYTITQSCERPAREEVESLSEVKTYYLLARSLIPSEKKQCQIGHVQALLLLVLINICFQQWTTAKLLIARSLDLASFLGFECLSHCQEAKGVQLGKAVSLGCHIIDSLLAFSLSHEPQADRVAHLPALLSETGPDEWTAWPDALPTSLYSETSRMLPSGPLHALSCFNQLFCLSTMINMTAQSHILRSSEFTSVQRMISELAKWERSLPLACRIIGPESLHSERCTVLLPHHTYLSLAYIATLLPLYLRLSQEEFTYAQSSPPSLDYAQKLLHRVLWIVTTHRDNFSSCGMPPPFLICLQTIIKNAQALWHSSCSFQLTQWSEALRQQVSALCRTLPAFNSLGMAVDNSMRNL